MTEVVVIQRTMVRTRDIFKVEIVSNVMQITFYNETHQCFVFESETARDKVLFEIKESMETEYD